MQDTVVGEFAKENKIPLLLPSSLKGESFYKEISAEAIDFFILADYGKILPLSLLNIPKLPIAVHPSLLPRYRGPAPINWVLINGESRTGVTIFKMNEHLDAGEIILQESVPISPEDDAITLRKKLAYQSIDTLLKALGLILKGNFSFTPQDEAQATFAPRFKKSDAQVNWEKDAFSLVCLVRGLAGWPQAYTYYHGQQIKILEVEAIAEDTIQAPSTIVRIDREGIYVATKKGLLKIKRLKPAGKREMSAYAFVLGRRIKEGERFE